MIKTAVVILSWNNLIFLKKFLKSVVDHSHDSDTAVIVADNGSDDGSAAWVEENFSEVRLIKINKNLGFAGGYNHALSLITSEYFVLLNSDIEVTEGWLKPLIEFMDQNRDAASCQPKIRSFEMKDYFEHAGAAGGYIDKYGFAFCRGRIFNSIEKDTGQYDDMADIFWSTGACMIVRSEAWRKCTGFDESFYAHMEEIDLCWRFHNNGYRVCCVPESIVYHIGGGSLSYKSPLKTYLNFRNSLFMLYKNLPEAKLRTTLFKRKMFDGLAVLFFLIRGETKSVKAVIEAHRDYYRSIGLLKKKRKAVARDEKWGNGKLVLNKSLVSEFYLRGHKTFGSLNF